MIRPTFVAAVSALLLCLPAAAPARDLGTPTGPVILSVTDAAGGTWTFDRAMIEALGWQTITTVTPFTEGPQEFAGIPLSALVDATGAEGTTIEAVAINDYTAQIPTAHIAEHGVFLALDHNGEAMRVRDRGPVWIIYPSETVDAPAQRFDSQMVWQLRELNFRQ
jgi:hypothetical protein